MQMSSVHSGLPPKWVKAVLRDSVVRIQSADTWFKNGFLTTSGAFMNALSSSKLSRRFLNTAICHLDPEDRDSVIAASKVSPEVLLQQAQTVF